MLHRDPSLGGFLEGLDVDGWIILDWILEKYGRKLRDGFEWLKKGISAGSCRNSNETSGKILSI
jgi:hypothetical protein